MPHRKLDYLFSGSSFRRTLLHPQRRRFRRRMRSCLTSSTACSHVRFQGAARSFLLRRRGLRRSLVSQPSQGDAPASVITRLDATSKSRTANPLPIGLSSAIIRLSQSSANVSNKWAYFKERVRKPSSVRLEKIRYSPRGLVAPDSFCC